jgi:hypothetical protein
VESFAEFGLPTQECIQIVGRIIVYSNEDTGLKENDIGIINTGEKESEVFKMKLNLQLVPEFTLFEGEIVMCIGVQGNNSVFNVNRILKPKAIPPSDSFSRENL